MSMFLRTYVYRLKSSLLSVRGIVSLIVALLIAIIPFIGLSAPEAAIPIGWIDEDNSEFSALLRQKVQSIGLLYIVENTSEKALISELQTGQLEGVMKVPDGFEQKIKNGEYEDTLIMMTSPYSTAFEVVSESVSRKAMQLWVASYVSSLAGDIIDQNTYNSVFENTILNESEPILVLQQLSGSTEVPMKKTAPIEEAAYTSLFLLSMFACFYMLASLIKTDDKHFNQRLLSNSVTIEKYRLALLSADATFLLPCVIPSLIGFALAERNELIPVFAVLFALYLLAYGGLASLVNKIKNRTTLMLTITLIVIVNLFLGSLLLDLPATGIISLLSYILPSRWLSSTDTLGVWWCLVGMLSCTVIYNTLPFVFRRKSD